MIIYLFKNKTPSLKNTLHGNEGAKFVSGLSVTIAPLNKKI